MLAGVSVWSSLRFGRAGSGLFQLSGVPLAGFERVFARLFVLGAELVSCGCSLSGLGWVVFRCSAVVAGHLALRVPCEGSAPLFVSASGLLLSGAAEARARLARGGRGSLRVAVQAERGRRCWA